jgi:hypothetical protein
MHLHGRTQCAARCLGEIVLKSFGARRNVTARPAGSISVDAAIIAGLFARCRWN